MPGMASTAETLVGSDSPAHPTVVTPIALLGHFNHQLRSIKRKTECCPASFDIDSFNRSITCSSRTSKTLVVNRRRLPLLRKKNMSSKAPAMAANSAWATTCGSKSRASTHFAPRSTLSWFKGCRDGLCASSVFHKEDSFPFVRHSRRTMIKLHPAIEARIGMGNDCENEARYLDCDLSEPSSN
jgi:hypothetical protein